MENVRITPKQRKVIRGLISGMSALQVANRIGIHENTIYRWCKEPAFQEALREAERESMKNLTISLMILADKATDTLQSVMENEKALDSSKVRAADIVLGRLLQTRELLELEERIAKLEDSINGTK